MDYASEVKKIIGEALSIYDGFNDKRETVMKEIAAALRAAYEAGAAEEKARVDKQGEVSAMAGLAEEREACAKVAEACKSQDPIEVFSKMENAVALKIAQAIRNRAASGSMPSQKLS